METGRPPSPHSRAAPVRWHAVPGRTADPGCATAVATGAGLRADRSRSGCARATCRRTAQGSLVRTRTATSPKPVRPYLISNVAEYESGPSEYGELPYFIQLPWTDAPSASIYVKGVCFAALPTGCSMTVTVKSLRSFQ